MLRLPKDLVRHAGDFLRAIRNHKYEHTDDGSILIGKATIGGVFLHPDGTEDGNTWTDQGLNYLLESGLRMGARQPEFYFAPFANNFTPSRTLTAATFPSLAGEIVSNTEGYTQAVRQSWNSGAAAGGSVDNTADRATLTIATASTLTVRGAAIVSTSAKGATTGVLVAAARFANDRLAYNGDPFPLEYKLTLNPV